MKKCLLPIACTICLLLIFVLPAFTQNITVRGKVTDKNEPLSGVNVMVKKTTVGTITNDKGEFAISAPPNGVLVFTYTGYVTKEIPIQGRLFITGSMETKSDQMEDVVVVGYGTQKKPTLTGAIASVKGEDLVKAPVSGISNALIGLASGMQIVQTSGEFGSDKADILIRGMATLNGSGRSPLIMVDGVERETFNNIDANEVETINILKDASATAVFGVRGANGVILITTKTGKSGRPRINFTSNAAMLQPSILPKQLGAYDYALLRNEAERNMGRPESFTAEDLRLYQTGEDPIFHSNINWIDELIKPLSFQQAHNMNISGGTDKLRYFTSLSYFNQDGAYRKPQQDFGFPYKHHYDRYNIRMNFDFNFTEDLSMSVKLGEQITDNAAPNGGAWAAFDKANKTSPMSGPVFVDGKYIENVKGLPSGVPFFNPWGQAGPTSTGGAYITENFANALNTNISLKYKLDKITPGLSIRAMGSYDSYYMKQAIRQQYFAAWTILKDPTAPGGYIIYKSKDEGPWYGLSDGIPDNNNNKWRKIYAEAGIEYNRTFAGAHHVTGLILGNLQKGWYPNLEFRLPTGYLGLVSRVTYDYKGRYLSEVNMGYNGSEQFPEGKRFGFFPSFSLGWVATEEPFFPKSSFVSFLKVRGSYGQVGNDKIGGQRYLYIDPPYTLGNGGYQAAVFGTSGLDMARYQMYVEGRLGNHDVTWEKATKWNIGADMQFFNNRLSVNGDYFEEKRDNILWGFTAPELVAASLPPANFAKVENHGYEMEVGYKDKVNTNLSYWIKTAYSFARNKIIFSMEPSQPYEYMQRTGRPMGQYFGLTFEGFYNTWDEINDPKRPISQWEGQGLQPGDMKYKDLNGDGKITSDDMGPIGYSNWPEITYSLSCGALYKGFDLSVLLQGSDHVSDYFTSSAVLPFSGDWGPAHSWEMERWTPERYANGEKISFPRLELSPGTQHNYQVSDFWVQNGSYLRLKNVELGYRFSNNLLKRVGLSSMRIYASGNNLITWTSMKYPLDPDARELWGRTYPPMRVFNAGINLQF
jgi:TonB-linked SusC/RagA family outer membrane protein